MTTQSSSHSKSYENSLFYEKMTEHLFLAELLQEAWFGFNKKVEVLRSEVDDAGYDLVLECNGTLRHIRLKSSSGTAKTARKTINADLAEKQGGCVVWIFRDEDRNSRRMSLTYRFFGGSPGKPLPSIEKLQMGRHSKGDATGKKSERPNTRVLPKGKFQEVQTCERLLELLFGLRCATH